MVSISGLAERLDIEATDQPTSQTKKMKFISLGYFDENKENAVPAREQAVFMDACFAYDDVLRKNGHVAKGEALQAARNAVTLRWNDGRVVVTDGPYAETKEQLGGFGIIEAKDLAQAVDLIARHPALTRGVIELRQVADLSGMIRESERRRATKGEAKA
jgi:hypothetical protein